MRPFRVDVAQADLDELADRLGRTRWPDQLPGVGWRYGVERDYLADLVEYWRTGYDWRVHEARLNQFPQFTTVIDGQQVHFLHVRSPEPDATPLIVTHGWPSTVYDFVDILGPLTDPRAHGGDPADAFHVVAPSLPGFAFSGPTTETGWGTRRTARAWAALMGRLGYDRYGAQGGDFGSVISAELGRVAPEHVLGVHVNALASAATPTDPADLANLTESDREQAIANQHWWYGHSGYATQMSTRPQTLAYALNDSPAGQLAWNLEWFVDCDSRHPRPAGLRFPRCSKRNQRMPEYLVVKRRSENVSCQSLPRRSQGAASHELSHDSRPGPRRADQPLRGHPVRSAPSD